MSENPKCRLFLSYGRRDAAELANRLRGDLEKLGYEIWQDRREIRAGKEWEEQIADGLRSTQVVIALLSPHAVRRATDPNSSDNVDSVCLDELTFARFAAPPTPIVPVMAIPCEPPFAVFRLDYVSMTQWMLSDDEYRRGLERLVAGIEAAATGKPLPTRRWHHCLPVLDFAAQLHEKRRDFVGRQWLFDEIDAWRASSTRERALLIVGDPGIGKSAFVAQMIDRNPGGQVLAYHICRADDPETLRPSTFVTSLAGMIAGRLPAFADLLEAPKYQQLFDPQTVSGRPAHVFDQGLIAALHQLPAPPDGIRYLLIDALDEALTLGEGQLNIVTLLSTRLDQFPAWLRIVATTRREPDVLNRLSGLRAASIDAHRQDNLDDIDRFIEARLQTPNLAERLAASRVPLATVQRELRDKADGNFLYVSQALQDIERDNYSFSRLDELPQGLNQWYEAWFARKFPNPKVDFVDARKVLEVILAAREPLTLKLLQEMTGLDPHYGLPEAIAGLSPLLVEVGGRHSLFHKSLADWLPDNKSKYRVSRAAGLQMVLGFMDKEIIHDPRTWGTYALKHALGHFAAVRFENCRSQISPAERDMLRPYAHQWGKINGSAAFHRTRVEFGIRRLFLSYSRREGSQLAMRLRNDLQQAGLIATMDLDAIPLGAPIVKMLEATISKDSDTIIVLASRQHFQRLKDADYWVMKELEFACCLGKGVMILAIDSPHIEPFAANDFPIINFSDWEQRYPERLATLLGWFM